MHFPIVVLQSPNAHCGTQSVHWNNDMIMTGFACKFKTCTQRNKHEMQIFGVHIHKHNTSTLAHIHTHAHKQTIAQSHAHTHVRKHTHT